jgi:aspartyl/asparaginyl-tRNA synthetase
LGLPSPNPGKTAFIILRDCTREAQCVIASEALKGLKLKVEDVVEISGTVRAEPRARTGCEVDVSQVHMLNRAGQGLPFQSAANVEAIGQGVRGAKKLGVRLGNWPTAEEARRFWQSPATRCGHLAISFNSCLMGSFF